MTGSDIKTALLQQTFVQYRDTQYRYISGIIYRRSSNGQRISVQLELMDKNKNSVVIANPQEVFILNTEV